MVAARSLGSTEKSVLIESGVFAMGIGRGSELWQLLTSWLMCEETEAQRWGVCDLQPQDSRAELGLDPRSPDSWSNVFSSGSTAFLLCPSPQAVILTPFSQSHPWLLLDFTLGTWPQN